METYIGVGELAARLGCTRQTVINRINAGQLHPLGKVSGYRGSYVFAPEAVEAYAAAQAAR